MPPGAAAGAAALDAAIHAWDIAVATGQDSPLTPDLARALTPVAKSIVEPLREYGVYAAALEPQAGADDAAALLGYLGRSPLGRVGTVTRPPGSVPAASPSATRAKVAMPVCATMQERPMVRWARK